jgi:hypothetical protein
VGLLSGPASVTRFTVVSQPEEPDFESTRFVEIEPGSSVRERIGFVPFEPETPYRIGQHRLAFRVRIDRLKPDPTAVRERVKVMMKADLEATGADRISARRHKEMRHQAEEELITRTTPRSKVIECCIDGSDLYVGSTANAYLGIVLGLLQSIEVGCEFKTPWLDRNDPEVESEIVESSGPGESVNGCRFLRALLKDPGVMAEPITGSIRLRTANTKVSLTGEVQNELLRYLKRDAEFLYGKLVIGEHTFALDALRHRIGSLRIETEGYDTWIELLDERLEHIADLFTLLDKKYDQLRRR